MGQNGVLRNLQLFAADGSEASTLAPDNRTEEKSLRIGEDCSFVPAAELFLLVAPGLVGITGNGMSWAEGFSQELEAKDIDASKQRERRSRENLDWVPTTRTSLRSKRDTQRMRRDINDPPARRKRSRSYRRRNRSHSRDRAR